MGGSTLLLSLSILFLIINSPVIVQSSSGWLRFCASGKTYRATPNDCSAGYWLKKPTSPQCICAHGVWILSKGYCDPHYAVVVGVEGTCFALSADVRWIRMIGVPDSPFAPFYFIANKFFDQVEVVAGAAASGRILGKSIVAGSINPSKSLQSYDGTTCMRPKRVEVSLPNITDSMNELPEDAIREVYADGFSFGPVVEAEEKPWAFQQLSVCDPSSLEFSYVYGVTPNHFYQNSELVNSSAIPNTCATTCTAEYEPFPIDFSLLTPAEKAAGIGDDGGSGESENFINIDSERPCISWDPKWNAIPNMTQTQIKEQTKRLATTQINYSLFKHKGPEVSLTEYKMLQKSRRVMEKVCPKEEVPPMFLRGALRMFRHALNESLSTYPYRIAGDDGENVRILAALSKCYEDPNAPTIHFNFDPKACPKKFTSASIKNPADKSDKKVPSYMACLDKYNTSQHDLIVESAWKVVLFSHYFCSHHFANSSYDHSRFLEKLALFFNREIQHRWFHPGKSYDAMKYVFRNYDLEKIAFGMDRCVGAARSFSPYRKWVNRPKFQQYCWQGQEFEYLNTGAMTTGLNLSTTATSGRPAQLAWEGSAYCLKSWKDPMRIVSGYKQEAQHACDKDGSANIFV